MGGGTVKARLDSGGYGEWQKAKYYVLVVFLAGALLGVNGGGVAGPDFVLLPGNGGGGVPGAEQRPGLDPWSTTPCGGICSRLSSHTTSGTC